MKMTLDIPDDLLREAKIVAAGKGTTLLAVVTRALRAELGKSGAQERALPSWRRAFGGVGHLKKESDILNQAIEETFGTIDDEARR